MAVAAIARWRTSATALRVATTTKVLRRTAAAGEVGGWMTATPAAEVRSWAGTSTTEVGGWAGTPTTEVGIRTSPAPEARVGTRLASHVRSGMTATAKVRRRVRSARTWIGAEAATRAA